MGDTQYECGAGRACRGSRIESGVREPALITCERESDGRSPATEHASSASGRGLCIACVRALRQAIRELGTDYGRLMEAASERPVTGQLAVSMTPDPSIPLNATVLALADELAQWAEAAMLLLQDALALKVIRRQRARGYPVHNGAVIIQAGRVLSENVSLLIAAEAKSTPMWDYNGTCWYVGDFDGVAVACKMIRAHMKVNGVLGEDNPRRRMAMPCPIIDCGMPTLGIDNGETDVTCTSCGGRWTEAEYDWLAGMITGSMSEREVHVLRYLLAEKTWQFTQALAAIVLLESELAEVNEKLSRITKLANLPAEELHGIDAATIVAYLLEIMDTRDTEGSTTHVRAHA